MILDIFSRYAVGWMVASRESAVLAERLIAEAVRKQRVDRNQLTLHADRGSSMASKPVAFLLADLGVTKSHCRPQCSNDNPYSEAQFKTLKYRPDFPERFGCIEDARVFCDEFFRWYNHEHRHSGIGLHTPADVHYGRAHASARPAATSCTPPTSPPRTLCPQATRTAQAARNRVDQQARRQGEPGSVVCSRTCLRKVDRFRAG